MTLDALPQPGSKRIPTLEIGDNGEAKLDLWCKSGTGQFSVAGNTVIFVPGQLQDRDCPPARAQADDDLVASLSEATTWRRRGDPVFLCRDQDACDFASTRTDERDYFQTDLSASQRCALNSLANASTTPLSSFWVPSSSPLASLAR